MTTIPPGWIKIGQSQGTDVFAKEKNSGGPAGGNALSNVMAAHSARVRQSSKPILNKLETEFYNILLRDNNHQIVLKKPWTFVIGNGVRYTPDLVRICYCKDASEFLIFPECRHRGGIVIDCYEVKGPWMTDDAAIKIKLAPGSFPFFDWWLVWKEKMPFENRWHRQLMVPPK